MYSSLSDGKQFRNAHKSQVHENVRLSQYTSCRINCRAQRRWRRECRSGRFLDRSRIHFWDSGCRRPETSSMVLDGSSPMTVERREHAAGSRNSCSTYLLSALVCRELPRIGSARE